MYITDGEIKESFKRMAGAPDAERVTARVMDAISRSERRAVPRNRFLAATFFAAIAVCAALTISAVIFMGRITPRKDGGYAIEMGLQAQSVNSEVMSDLWNYCSNTELNKYKAAYEYGKKFASWDEVSEYLGIQILKNELLDGIPENVTAGGEICLVSYADDELKNLLGINVYASHKVGDESCRLAVFIPLTDLSTGSFDIIQLPGNGFTGENIEYDTYTSPSGIESSIAISTAFITEKYGVTTYYVNSYFVNSGLGYSVCFAITNFEIFDSEKITDESQISTDKTKKTYKDEAISLVKQVIDGFHK